MYVIFHEKNFLIHINIHHNYKLQPKTNSGTSWRSHAGGQNKKIRINENNKNDVIKLLGPPSVESTFDEDLMFYIERKILTQGLYKLGKRKILTNNVLIVKIDNRGILVKKEFIDLSKMNDLEITKKITEIDYQKTSFIYDFLSSMRQKVNDPLGKKTRK